VLLYRGYPIEQIAEQSNFLEVSYLLMQGELPTKAQMTEFEHEVTHHSMMRESLRQFLNGFHYDAHPMAMLCAVVGSLAAFYHDSLDNDDPKQRHLAAIRLIAKMPTIAAACYRYSIGWPIRFPRNNLEYCTRFLHMMFEVPSEPLELPAVAAKALDLLFILHADHEQNASTSTVRLGRLDRRQSLRLHRGRHRRRSGARRTAARTKPYSTCWPRSETRARCRRPSTVPRTRTRASA
jgi:citrate synthase